MDFKQFWEILMDSEAIFSVFGWYWGTLNFDELQLIFNNFDIILKKFDTF